MRSNATRCSRRPRGSPGRVLGPRPGLHDASPPPPAARLATSLEGFDIASVQQQRQEQSYFVRLGSLSERLRQRAYEHSLGKLQHTRQRAQDALLQLAQALSLVRPGGGGRGAEGTRSRKASPNLAADRSPIRISAGAGSWAAGTAWVCRGRQATSTDRVAGSPR